MGRILSGNHSEYFNSEGDEDILRKLDLSERGKAV